MSLKGFVVSGLAVIGLLVATQGCSVLGGDSSAKEDRLCTPGANVFCRCADRSEGTKLCADDGKTFATPCATNDARNQCAGGEVDDPNTGKDVDSNGNVVDPDPGTDPGQTTTNALDACPGKSTSLMAGQDVVLEGDTTGGKDIAKGTGACAAGAGAPENIYRLIPTGSGSVSFTVQGTAPLNPTVYIRSTCDKEDTQVRCSETTGAGGTETFTHNMVAGTEYFLFVDGASGSAGKYKVTAKLTTMAFCGDGKITDGEACDDVNKVDGDGCDASCQHPNGDPSTSATCPGQPVDLWPGKTVTATGSTLTGGTTWRKTGTSCTVSTSDVNVAQEHIYEIYAHTGGTLTVTATPTDSTFNLELIARSNCTDATTQLACANSKGSGDTSAETMTMPVSNGGKYYVAVDGVLNAKGSYNISFKIQ